MAEPICIHCGETHPGSPPFCPNRGLPLRSSGSYPPESEPGPKESSPSWVAPPPDASGPGASGASHHGTPGGLNDPAEKGVLDLLQWALTLYRQHTKLLLTVAAVVFVPGALAHSCARAALLGPTVAVTLDPTTHLPIAAPFGDGSMVGGFARALLGMLAAAVTGVFLHGIIIPLAHGALALTAADRLVGGHASWREIWAWLFRRLGTVLRAIIPAALLVGAGFFFLVLPGLLLAFFFAFVPTVALFEGIAGTAALRRSFDLVKADWLRLLLLMILFGLISGLAQFVASLIPAGLFLSRFLQDTLTLLAMPIPVLGSVLLYFDIRRKHDLGGFDEQKLAAEMQALRG